MASQTPNGDAVASFAVKAGLAQMLKGGVIMDVVTPEHAMIAQEAGAVAVMALERIPADIRAAGGVARMSHPALIKRIMDAVTIPVMAKVRIGHLGEARQLEALGIDYIDESEVLTPADDKYHVNKHNFKVPFVCGARDLGEALRRIAEGAAMIRSKGEAGSGNIVEAVRHMRAIRDGIAELHAQPGQTGKALAPRPRIIKTFKSDGIDWHFQVRGQNRCALFEFLGHPVHRTLAFRIKRQVLAMLKAVSAGAHGIHQIGIRVNRHEPERAA